MDCIGHCHGTLECANDKESLNSPKKKLLLNQKISNKQKKQQKNLKKKEKSQRLLNNNNNNKNIHLKTKMNLIDLIIVENIQSFSKDKDNLENNNNNNSNNNNNNDNSIDENDFVVTEMDKKIEVEVEEEEERTEELINNNVEDFKILNVSEFEFEFETEIEEDIDYLYDIHVEGEEIEEGLFNKKRQFYKRSSKENKKEKINVNRYQSVSQRNKELSRLSNIALQNNQEKDKRTPSQRIRDITYKGPTSGGAGSYEQQLQRALTLSQSDYDKQMRNTMPLSQAQINDLLNRELTPEDYELLLLLDTTVKPKTISESDIQELPTIKYGPDYHHFPSCMICLHNFDENEYLTKLPCNHIYHINCISNWLANSSTKCPIDNISINNS